MPSARQRKKIIKDEKGEKSKKRGELPLLSLFFGGHFMKKSKIYFAISIIILTVIFCIVSCGKQGGISEKSKNNAADESENTINIIFNLYETNQTDN